jgi:hypothetical protein
VADGRYVEEIRSQAETMKMRFPLTRSLVGLALLAGCSKPPPESVASTVQEVQTGTSPEGDTLIGMDVLLTDDQGQPLSCVDGTVTMTVEISRNGMDGPWVLVDRSSQVATCVPSGNGDLALVVDNSGSQEGDLPIIQEGAHRALNRIVTDGGRMSLVRVSTNAEKKSELVNDTTALGGAIDSLFINKGWTSLWDGVRMANETLGMAQGDGIELVTEPDAQAFCANARKQGIVLFTDGAENNSKNEKLTSESYPGDGIDTTLDDLLSLRVGGSKTPVYAIGLGDNIDASALSQLATSTGGRFLPLDDISDVDDMLDTVSQYFGSTHRVCSAVPSHLCGSLEVRVTHEIRGEGGVTRNETLHHLEVPCDTRAKGRVATILLTMTASEVEAEERDQLMANAINWASPVDAPRVLFVLDDFHHGEFADDTQALYEAFATAGYDASYLQEPDSGIKAQDLAGYDVVWFSNPGYPMDDKDSFNALLDFSAKGGGVVLQGDDMTWSNGNAFPTTPLTHLRHVENGTSACGVGIDNLKGGRYRVTMNDATHPVIEGLESHTFLYGDDIDKSVALDGTEVLAWATVEGKPNCEKRPVVTAFTPVQK